MTAFSIAIITLNEERNIRKCLSAIQDLSDDIVVIDSYSTDQTAQICQSFPRVRFIQEPWKGYAEQKNSANAHCKHDWILSLDADEWPDHTLHSALLAWKEKNPEMAGFNRLTNYCGKWIRHSGWYPDFKIRLFNKTRHQWQGDIHEELNILPSDHITSLPGDCLHYSYYHLEEHLRQADKFSGIAAKELFKKGIKPTPWRKWLSAIAKFFSGYIIHKGFLDGQAGFTIMRISVKAAYMKYAKLEKMHAEQN